MVSTTWIAGVTVGVVIGALLALGALYCIMYQRRRQDQITISSRRASTTPMRDIGTVLSDSIADQESPKHSNMESENGLSFWPDMNKRRNLGTVSGVPRYSYKDLKKATGNFTILIGQGAFGSVYKAQMPTGETLAVKVLATNSKQGEHEFKNEVLLLGRLHHRNLVNLVGYCTEKGHDILVYAYMTNGSLASQLYGEDHEPLSWDLRVDIALDVAKGLEYLHDGAIPPVVHRDIKSGNILLDASMRARVSDFGLSKEDSLGHHISNLKGTFGYLDPEYISSRLFTRKSDVYSYGVLLFELIVGRNPQHGLMEYVELANINAEGRVGWEEIADPQLNGAFDVKGLNDVAALAYKCVNRLSKRRPSMRDVVQSLTRIIKASNSRKRHVKRSLKVTASEDSNEIELSEYQSSASEHRREESIDSLSDFPDV